MKTKKKISDIVVFVIMTLLAISFLYPIIMILLNSLKKDTAISTDSVFDLPIKETFAGFSNYVNALESKGFAESFGYSLFITVSSVLAICICCSMCAWFITRVKGKITNAIYYMFVFF